MKPFTVVRLLTRFCSFLFNVDNVAKGKKIVLCQGKELKLTYRYMENSIRLGIKLVYYMISCSKYERIVIDYIVNNLVYDTNIIRLNAAKIADNYKVSRFEISRAISKLCDADILVKVNKLVKMSPLPKDSYGVNFNYILKADIEHHLEEFGINPEEEED